MFSDKDRNFLITSRKGIKWLIFFGSFFICISSISFAIFLSKPFEYVSYFTSEVDQLYLSKLNKYETVQVNTKFEKELIEQYKLAIDNTISTYQAAFVGFAVLIIFYFFYLGIFTLANGVALKKFFKILNKYIS